MERIGKQLRAIQFDLGVSPTKVAAEAGIHIQTLYKVYGDRNVHPDSRERVVRALNRLKQGNKAS